MAGPLIGLLLWLSMAWAGPFEGLPEGVLVQVLTRSPVEEVHRVGDVTVRLRKAPGPDNAPTSPWCRGAGVDLFVEGDVGPAEQAVLDVVCARLPTEAPVLVSVEARPPPPDPGRLTRWGLDALVLVWLGLLSACLPRVPAAWGWAAVGALVRVGLQPAHVLMGVAYPYDRLLTYAGLRDANYRYGLGWPTFMAWMRPLFGASPDRLHTVDLVLSVLVVPLCWAAAERLGGRRAGHLAAALAALLPLPVALATTETMFVLVATLHAAALAAWAREDRLGDGLLAASAALLVHVRPLQIPVAAVWLLLLVPRRRWLEAGVVGGFLALRVDHLSRLEREAPGYDLDAFLATPLGPGSPLVALDPTAMPLGVPALAVLGAVALWRAERKDALVALGLVLAAATAPYLAFHRVTDLARFHLPTMVTWAVLAGLSATAWPKRRGGALAMLVLVGLTFWPAREPLGGPMVHRVEHALATSALCGLPEGTQVVYDPGQDPAGAFARWVRLRCGTEMVPSSSDRTLAAGTLVWRGRADRYPNARPAVDCDLTARVETFADPYDGGLDPLGPGAVRLGLYEVTVCR